MDKQTGKLIARIAENLPDMDGDIMQGWIDNPKGLQNFLRGLCPPEVASVPFHAKVWKTIKLGAGPKTAGDFRKAIKAAGMKIGERANDILGKSAFSGTEQKVDLVVVTPKELGFSGNATFQDICSRAIQLGYEPCPAKVGPQLRLQNTDQPKDERLVVAMEPIADSSGRLSVFVVEHGYVGLWLHARGFGGLWLHADHGNPDHVWYTADRFVFVRRK